MAARVSRARPVGALLAPRPGAPLGRAIATSTPLRGTKHLDWYQQALRRQEELRSHVDPPPYPAEPLHGRKRARAFFDFQFGRDAPDAAAESTPTHRVVFELADDIVPTTAANFLAVSARRAVCALGCQRALERAYAQASMPIGVWRRRAPCAPLGPPTRRATGASRVVARTDAHARALCNSIPCPRTPR